MCRVRVLVCLQSISRGKGGRGGYIPAPFTGLPKLFTGQLQRPDLEAMVASGLFEECATAVEALAAAGVEGLHDTVHNTVYAPLAVLVHCRQQPGCEARIRTLAPALGFCLENELDIMEQLGATTASKAAQICESPGNQFELHSVLT